MGVDIRPMEPEPAGLRVAVVLDCKMTEINADQSTTELHQNLLNHLGHQDFATLQEQGWTFKIVKVCFV